MGNVCTRCVRRKTRYKDKAEPPRQQVQDTSHSERSSTLTLEEEEQQLNSKDCYNLTEIEKKGINIFLLKDLYEKELKFKRPTAEVECITSGVKTIVEQLMAYVGREEPLLEISQQYLVGSMAEETSIGEPDEFDFLVVLEYFSKPGATFIFNIINNHFSVKYATLYSLRKCDHVLFNEDQEVQFADLFMSKLSKEIILSKPAPLYVKTDHGRLTINSTTVCHHGPANVVKLLWEPKSKSSTPLDILIDITPCIEQNGIDNLYESDFTKMIISDRYKSQIMNNDTFMLIPTNKLRNSFEVITTTNEVKLVNAFSSHHKTCYMILKYCFNTIVESCEYHTMLPSYLIKTFILRHVKRCDTKEKGHRYTEDCLFTCVLDIADDLHDSVNTACAIGFFATFKSPFSLHASKKFMLQVIDNVIGRLVQIGKEGYSVDRHEDFRKACHRTPTNHAIQERAEQLALDKVECHLTMTCKNHD